MTARSRPRAALAVLAAWVCAAALLVALPVALPATVAPVASASAANAADWNPGNIIDDALFYDGSALSASDIQAFLQKQVPNCRSGYTCLKDYRQNTDDRPADKYCNGYAGAANESAATIIAKVGLSCGISQKAMLVLLEKEQRLVSSTWPEDFQYKAATGQGCPDTAPCDASTAGFFYQVYYAARQFEIYRLNPTWWGYQAGRWNNILYNPTTSCGTQRVYIENAATAGLYIYTPYVPNAAALRNLYGEGDGCSAYGNRNFWRIYTDWFGSTRDMGNPYGPIGSVDAITRVPGGFQVSGWTADPETSNSISVQVRVEGTTRTVTADGYRADVAAAYPTLGGNHAFSLTVPAAQEGDNTVCVIGINVGQGRDSQLKCDRLAAMAGSPFGNLEGVTAQAGAVAVGGWAIDPDTTQPIAVHVYVDGVGTALLADSSRTDVAGAYPAYGAKHGFGAVLPAAPGARTVCAYGINTGLGGNVQLGCRTVTVGQPVDQGRVPFGALDAVVVQGTRVTASGWAIDPDTSLPIQVRIEASGASSSSSADLPRSDVGAAYPAFGPNHGFATSLTLMGGKHDVCVFAVNNGKGGDGALGCRTITIPVPDLGRAPIGMLEGVSVSGMTATVSGWALDLDTTSPVSVHIYVGSRGAAYTADSDRPDVGAAYPLVGSRHGFAERITVPAGTSSICVYVINNGAGGNSSLGCRTVDVADHSRPPIGNLEAVGATAGAVTVGGWALDPDTSDPIAVHVYVDGIGTAILANVSRADIAAAFPGMGDRHGFSARVPAAKGSHTVCVYPINDVEGPNTFLGCQTVTVG
ncbi:hypothetical protein CSIV_05785 [Microbacterium sp. CSI-V]|uniref:hypothetical protein n=1 Tax=unclassified Microbacterium TaxID=2609290 RepID=UPI00097BB9D4|nr:MULTISPECIES: hypothetical protein [unclassified Microbacterium]MXS74947.1 hypothetical protein [Microbacterium sp. TL13]ONI65778.1 hypothetical protein CSIV_05785 [Microbacterium sp. CSI-V]